MAAAATAEEPPIVPGEKLTLERAIAVALEHHPARMAAQAQAGAAGERKGEARAYFLPQVFGVTEYLRGTDNGIGDTAYLPALGVTRAPTQGRHVNQLTETFDNYLAAVSAFQYLFDFGRTRGLVEQRDAEADAQEARLRLVELDLVYQVSKTYFDLVAAKEIVTVFEKAVVQRTEHLREAQVKAKAGLKPDIDVYTAQSDLARAQLQLVDARNAAATAKVALDNAMGLGEHAPEYWQSDQLTYEQITDTADGSLERAFAQRPDLKMLLDEARAAGAEVKQYRSDYLPRVGGGGWLQRPRPGRDTREQLLCRPGRHVADLQRVPHRSPGGGGETPPGRGPALDRGPPAADRAPGEAVVSRLAGLARSHPSGGGDASPPRVSNSSLRRSVTRPGWARSSS